MIKTKKIFLFFLIYNIIEIIWQFLRERHLKAEEI
jgi:hypothetical protein